jgi:hypothetical protein
MHFKGSEMAALSPEMVGQDPSQPTIEQTFLTDKLAQLLCNRYDSSKTKIEYGEPWEPAVADFIPFIDAYARDDDHEDLARGLTARLFELSYRRNKGDGGSIHEFTMGVLDVLSQLRHVPDSLMRAQGNLASVSLSHIRSDYFSPGRYDQRANLAPPARSSK